MGLDVPEVRISDVITIRGLRPTDEGLVYTTGARMLVAKVPWMRRLPHRLAVESAVSALRCDEIRVAAVAESDDVVLGFAAVDQAQQRVDLVWVKSQFRRQGIGRMLVYDLLDEPMRYPLPCGYAPRAWIDDFGELLSDAVALTLKRSADAHG